MLKALRRTTILGWHFVRDNTSSTSRSNLVGAMILFLLVNLTFLPFIWGGATLQESANDTASLYITGSRQQSVVRHSSDSVLDPGAPSWLEETEFAVEHYIIFAEKAPPIWNPYASFGTPLAADAESQPYYPLAWIPVVWSNAEAYDIYVASRIFVGALFAFLLLRLFAGFAPALISGVAFMYSGYFWLYLTMPHLSVEILLPAMLYCLERVLRSPGLGTAALMALIVACMLLGGMPESVTLAFAFGAIYVAARIALCSEIRLKWRAFAPYLALGTIVGTGLSAVMLIPLLEYLPLSSNLHSTGSVGLGNDGFSWSALATYLAPLYLGPPWENVFNNFQGFTLVRGFFGCVSLFLAAIGFFSSIIGAFRRRTGNTSVPLVLGIVATVLLLKRFGFGLVNWIGGLPILRQIIFPKYEEAIIGCCVALLAGFGVARLYEKRVSTPAIMLAAMLPLTILTVAAGENRQPFLQLSQHQDYYLLSLAAALIFLGLTSVTVMAFHFGKLKPVYFLSAIFVLVLAEPLATYVIPLHYVLNAPPPQSTSALLGAPYITYLKSKLSDHDRLFAQDGLLYPQWSGAFGIADTRGLDALYYKRYLPFVGAFLSDSGGDSLSSRFVGLGDNITTPMSQRFLALSSVHYVATTQALANSNAFRKVYDANGVKVFEFGSPLPRISIFHHIIRAATPEDALRDLKSNTFDPYFEAVVEGQSADFRRLPENARSPVSAGRIEEYRSTFVKALVNTGSTAALVVLNDTNFPGWSAFIDGRRTSLFNANYLFRGIVVPSGRHVIEYRYNPRSFIVGLAVSIVSLLTLVGMIVAAFFRRTNGRENLIVTTRSIQFDQSP